jgi:hypothetical protein
MLIKQQQFTASALALCSCLLKYIRKVIMKTVNLLPILAIITLSASLSFARGGTQVDSAEQNELTNNSFVCRNSEGKVSIKGTTLTKDVQAQKGYKAGDLQAIVVDEKTATNTKGYLFVSGYDAKNPFETWELEANRSEYGAYFGLLKISSHETMHPEEVICRVGKED